MQLADYLCGHQQEAQAAEPPLWDLAGEVEPQAVVE